MVMTTPRSDTHARIPVSDIAARLAERIEGLCRHLLPEGHRERSEWRCGSIQGEPGNSLGVRLTGVKAGVWCDFEDGAVTAKGDPLDLIQACLTLNKGQAIAWAKAWLGIGDETTAPLQPPPRREVSTTSERNEVSGHQRSALKIWRSTRPAENTPVQNYLRGRGIGIVIPPTIRYHPALLHPDIDQHLPAMIAAVCNVDRKVTGIQRIYLTMDGRKAPLTRPKMALGTLRGGAVRLAPTIDRVWLTEGVEDGLAVMQMMGEPAWATLGTSGFKSVELPESIKQVVLAPDGDDAGQAVLEDAARRLASQSREVRAAKLPPGKDWCDVLDTYEERAGILEFDFEQILPDAETLARQEVIYG